MTSVGPRDDQHPRLVQLAKKKLRWVAAARIDVPAIPARLESVVHAAVDPAGGDGGLRARGPKVEDAHVATKEPNVVVARVADTIPGQHGLERGRLDLRRDCSTRGGSDLGLGFGLALN